MQLHINLYVLKTLNIIFYHVLPKSPIYVSTVDFDILHPQAYRIVILNDLDEAISYSL